MDGCDKCSRTAMSLRTRPSFEYGRDLLDIDAILGHAQVVIGDDREDGIERTPDSTPDHVAGQRGDAACHRAQCHVDRVLDDKFADDQQDDDPEYFPAMSFG